MKKYLLLSILGFLACTNISYGYDWPVSGRYITGTFGEMRGNCMKFHNGVDIRAISGTKVYTVKGGQIRERLHPGEDNEIIWIGNISYVHVAVKQEIVDKYLQTIEAGVCIGETNWKNHVHLIELANWKHINPLRKDAQGRPAGLAPFNDSDDPYFGPEMAQVVPDFGGPFWTAPAPYEKRNNAFVVGPKFDIIAMVGDIITNGTTSAGLYELGYEVYNLFDPIPVIPEQINIKFYYLPEAWMVRGIYAIGSFIANVSGSSVFRYIITNKNTGNDYIDSLALGPGNYRVEVIARDADGNEAREPVFVYIPEPPIIFDEEPVGDIGEREPKISAKVVSPSEIIISSAKMYLDDNIVAEYHADGSTKTEIQISYIPEEDLPIGEHTVKVTAEDVLGWEAEPKEWTFTVISEEGFLYVADFNRIVKTKWDRSGWQTLDTGPMLSTPRAVEYDKTTGYIYFLDEVYLGYGPPYYSWSYYRLVKTNMDGDEWVGIDLEDYYRERNTFPGYRVHLRHANDIFYDKNSGYVYIPCSLYYWKRYGSPPFKIINREVIRTKVPGTPEMGFRIDGRPYLGGIHYDCETGYIYLTEYLWEYKKITGGCFRIDFNGSDFRRLEGDFKLMFSLFYDNIEDFIYLTEYEPGRIDRIRKINMDGEGPPPYGEPGRGVGQFYNPKGISYDKDTGFIYVADRDNGRIVRTKIDGTGWDTLDGFHAPRSVYYTGSAQSNMNSSSILMASRSSFSTSNNEENIEEDKNLLPFPYSEIVSIYGRGNKDGQIWNPAGYCSDKEGNLYILDKENCRIQKYNKDFSLLSNIGEKGLEDGQLLYPSGIAMDKERNIYIADTCNHRIQKFARDGEFLLKFGSEETEEILPPSEEELELRGIPEEMIEEMSKPVKRWKSSEEDGKFTSPEGITVDEAGNIYVVDLHNSRVQKFSPEGKFIKKWDNNKVILTAKKIEKDSSVTSASTNAAVLKKGLSAKFKKGEIYSFPNPAKQCNPTIHVECGIADKVEIKIYNIAGELVKSVVIKELPSVVNNKYAYEYTWDTTGVPSGVYIYVVQASKEGEKEIRVTNKLALIK